MLRGRAPGFAAQAVGKTLLSPIGYDRGVPIRARAGPRTESEP